MLPILLNKVSSFKALDAIKRRSFTKYLVLFNKKESEPWTGHLHRVNKFERRMLVWTGKYKKLEDVPDVVHPSMMEKARSRTRIRAANWLIVILLAFCAYGIYSGRKLQESGDSLISRSAEMHRKYREDSAKNIK